MRIEAGFDRAHLRECGRRPTPDLKGRVHRGVAGDYDRTRFEILEIRVDISFTVRRATDLAAILTLPVAGLVWVIWLYLPDWLVIGLGVGITVLFASIFFLAWRYKYRCDWLLSRVALLGCSACFTILAWNHKIAFEHEIGEPNNYDAFNGVCGRVNRVLLGPNRVVVVLREVECTGAPIIPPSRDYFVFVHADGNGENDYRNLALSYRVYSDSDSGWRTEPTLKWLRGSSLLVSMGATSYIWTKRSSVNDVQISYSAGGTEISDEYRWAKCARAKTWCDY